MKKLQSLATLSMVLLFALSCTKTEVEDPEVVLTKISTSKTDVFIEEAVTISLEATGYTDIKATTSDTKIKITKVASTIFEVRGTEATSAKIFIELKNNNNKNKITSTTINFVEHGVKNFNTVEGIKVNTDTSDKVLKLLGEPDYKVNSTDGLSESWKFLSKGISLTIVKTNKIVEIANILSSNYYYTDPTNDSKKRYSNYASEIGNGWKINSSSTTMDLVVDTFGVPLKSSSPTTPTLRAYQYTTQRLYFNFIGETVDDYKSKIIDQLTIY